MKIGRLRHLAFAFILCAAAGLSGCALVETAQKMAVPETEPTFEETTLWVKEDGTWTEILIEKLDQAYYDSAELKKLVEETVAAYNAQNGEGAVAVEEYANDVNGVTLRMTYRDAAAYAGFNRVAAFQGSMLEAQMEGFLFLNDFRAVDSDGSSSDEVISNEEPLSHKEYQVLVTDTTHVVRMPERVRYVSANGRVAEWKTVAPAGTQDEPEGLVLPSSAVYKEEKRLSQITEDDREKGYLYIIYE